MLKSDFSEDMGKYSLTEKIYQALRSDILSGAFKDNEELKENTLAKSYGVSRTPVREAIRQLALEGLVDTIPNRGAFVHNIHCKDVEDVYAIRSLMEGLAARWAWSILRMPRWKPWRKFFICPSFTGRRETGNRYILPITGFMS